MCVSSYHRWYASASPGELGRDWTSRMPLGTGCSFVGSRLPVDPPVLHDEADLLESGDVAGGIAGHGDDVGEVAGGELSQLVVHLDELGARDRRRPQGLRRGHAPVDEGDDL